MLNMRFLFTLFIVFSSTSRGLQAQIIPEELRNVVIQSQQQEADAGYRYRQERQSVRAANQRQGFTTQIDAAGVHIQSAANPAVTLKLQSMGCAEKMVQVKRSAPHITTNSISRVEYQLGRGVSEWYENGPLGIEQGFTLQKPLHCSASQQEEKIKFHIAVQGAQTLKEERFSGNDAKQITITTQNQILHYSELSAIDATGRKLPSQMAVKQDHIEIAVDTKGAHYPLIVDPLIWTQQTKLTADDKASGDNLGKTVAVSGNTAMVGAPSKDNGVVYVFVRDPKTGKWSQKAKLTAKDQKPSDYFGNAIALSDNIAMIGATNSDNTTSMLADTGAVYIFERNQTGEWTEKQKITSNAPTASELFGSAIALDKEGGETTAMVGAPYSHYKDPVTGVEKKSTGAVYVFSRNEMSGVWTQTDKLYANPLPNAHFGNYIALSGNEAIMGIPTESSNTGAVYSFYFDLVSKKWTLQSKITAKDSRVGDSFGVSVALFGDTAIIGAQQANINGQEGAGAAYVFLYDTGSYKWMERQKLTANTPSKQENFGNSVALSGETGEIGVVGALQSTVAGKAQAGAAYVFKQNFIDRSWSYSDKLAAEDAAGSSFFGNSLAISNKTVLIGAENTDTGTGAAYVFNLGKAGGENCSIQKPEECATYFCQENKKICGLPGLTVCSKNTECTSNQCINNKCLMLNGDAQCTQDSECLSGHCVEGVCCNTACTRSAGNECLACSITKGAAKDGECGLVVTSDKIICREAAAVCDIIEMCNGKNTTCPIDRFKEANTVCRASSGANDPAEVCSGGSASCPNDPNNPTPPTDTQIDSKNSTSTKGCHCTTTPSSAITLDHWLLPFLLLALAFSRVIRRPAA